MTKSFAGFQLKANGKQFFATSSRHLLRKLTPHQRIENNNLKCWPGHPAIGIQLVAVLSLGMRRSITSESLKVGRAWTAITLLSLFLGFQVSGCTPSEINRGVLARRAA